MAENNGKLKFIFLEIPRIHASPAAGISASQVQHLPIMQHIPHKAKFIL